MGCYVPHGNAFIAQTHHIDEENCNLCTANWCRIGGKAMPIQSITVATT